VVNLTEGDGGNARGWWLGCSTLFQGGEGDCGVSDVDCGVVPQAHQIFSVGDLFTRFPTGISLQQRGFQDDYGYSHQKFISLSLKFSLDIRRYLNPNSNIRSIHQYTFRNNCGANTTPPPSYYVPKARHPVLQVPTRKPRLGIHKYSH
jgi:hypothetical protein